MIQTSQNARNSRLELNQVYFWTDTIYRWKNLIKPEKYKALIISELRQLVEKKYIRIYGFVIMPNHIHVIWEMLKMNGREKPYASFNKATAHLIVKDLKLNHPNVLTHFKVSDNERSYRIWQRDALGVLMDSRNKLEQKLDYLHENPLQEKWQLVQSPEEYRWSSARFYEDGVDGLFGFLTHYRDRM